MSDCEKIDRLLWGYPNISVSEKAELERHLVTCADCREAFEAIKAVENVSEADKEQLSAIDSVAFDAAVMRKIRLRKKPVAIPEKFSKRYTIRMALSFTVAACVVLFLVKSISDISEIPSPFNAAQKGESETYNVINIELGRQKAQETMRSMETPKTLATAPETKKDEAPESRVTLPSPPSMANKDTGEVLALQPPPEIEKAASAPSESTNILAMTTDTAATKDQLALNENETADRASEADKYATMPSTTNKKLDNSIAFSNGMIHSRGTLDMSAPPVAGGTPVTGEGFSILPSPMTNPAPDSVNIGAIYVTNENISLTQQTRAASLTEIYKDTGSVQVMMPQSSVLVTVEKMPKPLKVVVPEYPVWARKQGLTGTLWVRARVESDGHIRDAVIVSCDAPGVGFEEEAIKAAKESIFTPASANGINLPVWIVYPVKFIYKE